jgi:hypothetical protein
MKLLTMIWKIKHNNQERLHATDWLDENYLKNFPHKEEE